MSRYSRVLVVLVAVSLLGACAPDGDLESALIYANLLVGKKTQCVVKAGGSGSSAETRPVGIMDLMVTNRYWMFPMVWNGLSDIGEVTGAGPANMALEAHIITFHGAWVTYEIDGLLGSYTGEPTELPKQWIATSGSVDPEKFGPMVLEVVPPAIGQALDNDIAFDQMGNGGILIANVVMEGQLADGSVVHTMEFQFPIHVCRGCLASYDVNQPGCCKFEIAPDQYPCFPGQDDRYSCLIGCWLNHRDRPPRYAEKMAMYQGYTKSLAVDLETIETPEWFDNMVAAVPGQLSEEQTEPTEGE